MSIYKKLFEAKKEIGKISKDAKNPFFKSNYLSLNGLIDAVEEVLVKHDLVLLQPIEDNKVITVIVDVTAVDPDLDNVKSAIQLPPINDPQKLGSAITYYRRYTLQSLLGLQAEDDDGNTATKQVKEERKPSLTIEQFQSTKNATDKQILTVLQSFRMSADQRKVLTDIKDKL